ncbi:glycoside hydrolase family 3 C-terminal domain-containing protein [uncultured Pseudoflavonifractor sp.]|uniref:beta-glucosidase n=1 Tax=uncultured Pseudoflavonifractor sp. TaxID=1221379 RepID=UPI0025D63E1B|nr:glycoside hydrolase family 3 C-terminal domain-containing protein [uncultured Pseudoflavonifractor sp.]
MKNLTKPGIRRLRRTLLPIMALLLALSCTLTAGMYANASTLNGLFGRGVRTVKPLEPSEELDADYYIQEYASKSEALAAAQALSGQISDEGIVLLKNNGILPLADSTPLTPLGLRYCLPYYGGSGSSAIGSDEEHTITPAQGLHSVFCSLNTALEERLFQAAGAADSLENNPNLIAAGPLSGASENHILYEFSRSVYGDLGDTCSGTVGVVLIGRQTGEDCDASVSVYSDGTPHMLALTSAEQDLISFAKASCEGVVVVLASSSPMEIWELEQDPAIDAILWLGGAGSTGYGSLARVLSGRVNPSGRLPDLWPSAFKQSPTFANQDDGSGSFVYANAFTTLVTRDSWEENACTPFREYEEGIYLGYRYYETAWDTGFLDDYDNRTSGVLYPFGYGLSYTVFSQAIVDFSERNGTISLTVRVTNTGEQYAGKEVVQVYFTPPYTDLDRDYAIEKPTAVLVQFAKTELLAPGEYEDVVLSFSKEDLASYCYTRDNGDGTTGCYMLEEGTYSISVRANSHDVLDSRPATVQETVWYDNSNPRQSELDAQAELSDSGTPLPAAAGLAAVNRFEQLNAYMSDPSVSGAVCLSRADWAGTQPSAPTDADRAASDTVRGWIADADTTKPTADSPEKERSLPAPVSGEDNGLVLADLRGKRYRDPMWTLLLDQIRYDDPEALRQCLFQAAYGTGALSAIGKPESVEHDGPQGLTLADVNGQNWIKDVCGYPAAPVMAAAWNQELMYDFGYMVGQEALLSGINGWYAPGLNIHRSPFGGRSSEYFSEDPLLSGVLGAQVISGAGNAGLSCAVKHFVLMDTEAHKNPHTCVWLTEQALREIYLRPYEIALKTACKTIRYIGEQDGVMRTRIMRAGDFLMAGDCAVGPLWSAANPALLTGVVRGEWGFQGTILSDMHLNGSDSQVDRLLRAGCDLLMSTVSGSALNATDFQSPAGQRLLRTAVKDLCYTLVNSNLMQGAAPGSLIESSPAPWEICLAAFNATVGLVLLSMAAILIWTGWYARRRL